MLEYIKHSPISQCCILEFELARKVQFVFLCVNSKYGFTSLNLKICCEAGLCLGRPHVHVHVHGHVHGHDQFQDLSLDLPFAIAETDQLHGLQSGTGVIRAHHRSQGNTSGTVVEVDGVTTGGEGNMAGILHTDVIGNERGTITPHVRAVAEAAAEVECVAGLVLDLVLLDPDEIEAIHLRGIVVRSAGQGAALDAQDLSKQGPLHLAAVTAAVIVAVGVAVGAYPENMVARAQPESLKIQGPVKVPVKQRKQALCQVTAGAH